MAQWVKCSLWEHELPEPRSARCACNPSAKDLGVSVGAYDPSAGVLEKEGQRLTFQSVYPK